jgi:hypothetical protein
VSLPPARTVATVAAAAVAHALGWYLPVIQDYRGWQAFRVAFSPVWAFQGFKIEPGGFLLLSVASAATNLLFVVLAVALLSGFGATRRRALALLWVAAGLTLLDLHWPASTRGADVTLESGYFVWVASFALLTLAAYFEVAADRARPP